MKIPILVVIGILFFQVTAVAENELRFILNYRPTTEMREFRIGIEMPIDRSSITVTWEDRIYHFNKKVRFLEVPKAAFDQLTAFSEEGAFGIIPGQVDNYVIVFEGGEVVNFSKYPRPYRINIPELKSRRHLEIVRRRIQGNALFFSLEYPSASDSKTVPIFFASSGYYVYEFSSTIKEAPELMRLQTMQGHEVVSQLVDEDGRQITRMTHRMTISDFDLGDSRAMTAAEFADWNARLASMKTSQVEVGVSMAMGRYAIIRLDQNQLGIIDRESNDAMVTKIPLALPEYRISETANSLLIYYPSINRTDIYKKGSFEKINTMSWCANDLRGWKNLDSPEMKKPPKIKIKTQRR